MEQTLFNELLHQANDLGKRADNGFKEGRDNEGIVEGV
jgi:hypothetical protein